MECSNVLYTTSPGGMGTDPRTVEGYYPYWGVLPLFLENIEKLCFGLV